MSFHRKAELTVELLELSKKHLGRNFVYRIGQLEHTKTHTGFSVDDYEFTFDDMGFEVAWHMDGPELDPEVIMVGDHSSDAPEIVDTFLSHIYDRKLKEVFDEFVQANYDASVETEIEYIS